MTDSGFDFGKRILDLTAEFVGREWLVEEVDAFVRGDSDQYLIVVGEPGSGKSAISARLTATAHVKAFHFCAAREGGTLDPIKFAGSLSHQLARTLPDYAQHILLQEPLKQIQVDQEIGEVHGGSVYGVYIDKFVVQTKSADAALQYLVREPLKSWLAGLPPQEGEEARVLLLVDALDEALRLDRHPNIVDLIDGARDLPPQVRWVLTSRPGDHFDTMPAVLLSLEDRTDRNEEDVRKYVDAVLNEPEVAMALQVAAIDAGELRDALATRSAGNFLYLRYVLNDLRTDIAHGRTPMTPQQLAVGLNAKYGEFLDRVMRSRPTEEWRRIYRPVLGVLAVAQEPLAFEHLVALSRGSGQDVNDVASDLKQLLDVAPNGGAIRIYHASFAEFLTNQDANQKYWIDPALYHQQVAGYFVNTYTGRWATCDHSGADVDMCCYGLKYAATHLSAAVQAAHATTSGQLATRHQLVERFVRFVLDDDFQSAHTKHVGDLAALQRDLERTVRAASTDGDPSGLPLLVEAARAIHQFRETHLRPEPVFALAREGVVDAAMRGLAVFDADPDWQQIARLVIAWLAFAKNPDRAVRLRNSIQETLRSTDPLRLLLARVNQTIDGEQPSYPRLGDAPPAEVAAEIVKRMGGAAFNVELLAAHGVKVRIDAEDILSDHGYLSEYEGPLLVAYAEQPVPEDPDPDRFVRDYIAIHTGYNYRIYRNNSLRWLLAAILRYNDPQWARDMATRVTESALAGAREDFQSGLPLAVLAWRAKQGDRGALHAFDAYAKQTSDAASKLVPGRSTADRRARLRRRLGALAEATLLLGRQDEADEFLARALDLPYGEAGFGAPAFLTLAESLRICRPDNVTATTPALERALSAAHNVQDQTFCARSTARVNAMRERWWAPMPPMLDRSALDRLVGDSSSPEFCAVHHVGDTYQHRAQAGALPIYALESARTLADLASVFDRPLLAFQRLNPGWSVDQELLVGTTVNVPDPGFPPLLAARLAGETLADPALYVDDRVALIQWLAPVAAPNATALDTVLSRLVLAVAARPADPLLLQKVAQIIPEDLLAETEEPGTVSLGVS